MKWIIFSAILAMYSGVHYLNRETVNNVCTTFEDYYTDRDKNENCYYNPDYNLTVPEIVKRHNYAAEVHNVTTPDGYILTMFRIPPQSNTTNLRPIFLQHGFSSSSSCFVNLGKKSLALLLAEKGHDVWIGNFRGSSSSRLHLNLTEFSSEYWNFSFHEYGIYDVPAQVEYVYNITNQKIIYIGYSIGTTSMYIYGITSPEVAAKHVQLFINLAPAVFMDSPNPLLRIALRLWTLTESILHVATSGKLHARYLYEVSLLKYLCLPYPFQIKMCQIPELMIFGFTYNQSDPETLPITFMKNADWSSTKVLSHLAQASLSGNFQNYDYGAEDNLKMYGLSEPPHYNLSEFKVPTYLICSNNDLVATKENAKKLYKMLPKDVKPYGMHIIENEEFNHLDFIMGKDVVPLLYNHVIDFISIN